MDYSEVTRSEKIRFLEICHSVCPEFRISESLKITLNDVVRWCLMRAGKYNPEKGLWIYGNIGTGKSTLLEIIRRYCAEMREPTVYRQKYQPKEMRHEKMSYGFRITNASFVAGAFAKEGYPGIDDYILNCRQAFDEVGREPIPALFYGNTENVFQYIFHRRYDIRNGDFTHVTSNLTPEQIADVYGEHIFDRCIEMFNFVEMTGESWREK